MKIQIEKQIELIHKANEWVNNSLEGRKQEETYNSLVKHRRWLKKQKYAVSGNPAAAVFGESQVGKSYLISSILSEKEQPYCVSDDNGTKHNFIEKINPKGNGSESTGIVSRFTVDAISKKPGFPLVAVLLTPSDIITTLMDSFFKNVNLKLSENYQLLGVEQINDIVHTVQNNLVNENYSQDFLTEDDLLDIEEYLLQLNNTDNLYSSRSLFFKVIPKIIYRISPKEWPNIFSVLWNNEQCFTRLFIDLISVYETINFEWNIHIPIDSILTSHGSIIDVNRLKEIYGSTFELSESFQPDTKIYLPNIGKEVLIKKSLLAALTREVVFPLPSHLVEKKPFLKQTDLLDFPGARAPKNSAINSVTEASIWEFFLRGKVSFLFNKYSDTEKINILLFCANHNQPGPRHIPNLIAKWVSKIGKSKTEREEFIKLSAISPFFVIETFFNMDLQYNPLHDKKDNSGTPLSKRWEQRFRNTLEREYFEAEANDWFNNWTESSTFFNNIYLLRDFEKSENPSRLFSGFNEYKIEKEEITPEKYPEFKNDLKQSFLNDKWVVNHFSDPELSWDEASTINKDGTDLIIQKLSIVSENINDARVKKFQNELNARINEIIHLLSQNYHADDSDTILMSAQNKVGKIIFSLDTKFAGDNILKFGLFLKEIMLSESEVLKLFREIINSPNHKGSINLDQYNNIRSSVPVSLGDTVESYFEKMCIAYGKSSELDKQIYREHLKDIEIDISEIINPKANLRKDQAQQLVEAMIDYWYQKISTHQGVIWNELIGNESYTEDLIEMYEKLIKKTNFIDYVSQKIRVYLNGKSKIDIPFEIIADISAELMNDLIDKTGWHFISESDIKELELANNSKNLVLNLDFNTHRILEIDEIFNEFEDESYPSQYVLPHFRNYNRWKNQLKNGFIYVCDIPNYDIQANTILGGVIENFRQTL